MKKSVQKNFFQLNIVAKKNGVKHRVNQWISSSINVIVAPD